MLGPLLESHAPVDLLILMLGTNDLQRHLGKDAGEAALGLGTLIEIAQRSGCGPDCRTPRVLAVAPYPFGELGPPERLYFAGNEREAEALGDAMRLVADTKGMRVPRRGRGGRGGVRRRAPRRREPRAPRRCSAGKGQGDTRLTRPGSS